MVCYSIQKLSELAEFMKDRVDELLLAENINTIVARYKSEEYLVPFSEFRAELAIRGIQISERLARHFHARANE